MMTYNPEDLKLSSYDYELPESQIAARPVPGRHNSKLMVYQASTDTIIHTQFHCLADFIPQNSLLVLNQSRVFPCRLRGTKSTGGKAEIFVLSLVPRNGAYPCLLRTTTKKKIGDYFDLPLGAKATIQESEGNGTFYLSFSSDDFIAYLENCAAIPIPPYIRGGESDEQDREDYQTIYAKEKGSVAAPTAGLHFTSEVFSSLKSKGINQAFVTLHVGPGTFAPVKAQNILEHKMHFEEYFVGGQDLIKLREAKIQQQKIFAVGTTTLRVLESSLDETGQFNIEACRHYSTDIFLHPGKNVRSIDGLITNFHLPHSTLLMLVSSLLGRKKTLELYEEAKKLDYRFFSYGDAMLIIR